MQFAEAIENHFQDPYHRGPCERPSSVASGASGNCELQIEVAISSAGLIEEAWFDGLGCATCEGIASMMMQHIEKMAPADVQGLSLTDLGCPEGEEPEAPCCRLPLELLGEALQELDDVGADEDANFGGPSLREEC